jgi:ADP-ribose diphosphatase
MDTRSWIVEASNVLFRHPRVTITEQTVRLPNGRRLEGYVQISVPEHVVIIVRSACREFLLQRQYKHGPRAVSLTFPAGVIELGEDPAHAACRELAEETGISTENWTYFGRFILNGNQGAGAAHLFMAECKYQICSPADPDPENPEIVWLSESELIEAAKLGQFKIISHALALGYALNPKLWPARD